MSEAELSPQEERYRRFSLAVDPAMTVLALVWLPLIVLPLVIRLRGSVGASVELADYLLWALFAAEYLTKLLLAPSRRRFVATHKIDLAMVVLPVLRPLRVVRALRLARGGTALGDGLTRARRLLTHKGLHFVLLSVALIVVVTAALEVAFEAHSRGATSIHNFGEGLWWAVVTVTTVGYGDRVPQSAAGEGVAVVLMLTGIALMGTLTATVASFFVSEDESGLRDRVEQMQEQLDRIEQLLHEEATPQDLPVAGDR